MAGNKVPFVYHLHELRQRLFVCVAALLVGAGIGYAIQSTLLAILTKPLKQQLYYSNPAGGFSFYFNICLLFAVLVALPVFMYNIVRFIQPALGRYTQIRVSMVMVSSILLSASGVAFAYFFSLPAALHFLMAFGGDKVAPLIFANEYLNFVIVYLLSFAILFQIPVIVNIIDKIKPLSPGGMMKNQRWIILGSFIAAAILTPTPDPLNQVIMASPVVVLYQFSIIYVWWHNRRNRQTSSLPAPELNLPDDIFSYTPQTSAAPSVVTLTQVARETPRPTRPVVQTRVARQPRPVDGVVNEVPLPRREYQTAAVRPQVVAERPIRRAVISDIMPLRPNPQVAMGQ